MLVSKSVLLKDQSLFNVKGVGDGWRILGGHMVFVANRAYLIGGTIEN